jgi:uncharacterized glyoxalase superfamily protein PhnB
MFKSGKISLIVDSVERAVRFYTDKLLFSIVELKTDEEGGTHIFYAEVRKGKVHVVLRQPVVDELAEFSLIRRCSGRSTGVVLEMKKGIDRYFSSCKKKGVLVSSNLRENEDGTKLFQIKDPFGLRLLFVQPGDEVEKYFCMQDKFCGTSVKDRKIVIKKDSDVPEDLVSWLKGLGVSRRVAKKYIKVWAKRCAAHKG